MNKQIIKYLKENIDHYEAIYKAGKMMSYEQTAMGVYQSVLDKVNELQSPQPIETKHAEEIKEEIKNIIFPFEGHTVQRLFDLFVKYAQQNVALIKPKVNLYKTLYLDLCEKLGDKPLAEQKVVCDEDEHNWRKYDDGSFCKKCNKKLE